MSNLNELNRTIAGMDDETLAALETSVKEAREAKRSRLDINSINSSMTKEQRDAARAEINRVLAGK